MKKLISLLLCALISGVTAADTSSIANAFQQKNYAAVCAAFNNLPKDSAERNQAGHYTIIALSQQNKNAEALKLAETLINENSADRAWQCRFKFDKMTVLNIMEQPENALKTLAAEDVPAAFLGEFYCLRGKLLNNTGQWRQALEAFYFGSLVNNNFAGRAQLLIGKTYEVYKFPLPALEAYLKVLSMRHATMDDRRTAASTAAKLFDQVDHDTETVQDVLKDYPQELKLVNAKKMLVSKATLKAQVSLDEIITDQTIPLPLRELSTAMKNNIK